MLCLSGNETRLECLWVVACGDVVLIFLVGIARTVMVVGCEMSVFCVSIAGHITGFSIYVVVFAVRIMIRLKGANEIKLVC